MAYNDDDEGGSSSDRRFGHNHNGTLDEGCAGDMEDGSNSEAMNDSLSRDQLRYSPSNSN